jgi:hypothetical protein
MQVTKPINVNQFAYELAQAVGAPRPVHVVGPYPDGTTKIDAADTDDATLQAVIDAHLADDNWVDPNYTPPAPDPDITKAEAAEDRLAELAGKGWASLTTAEKGEVAQLAMESIGFRRRAQ